MIERETLAMLDFGAKDCVSLMRRVRRMGVYCEMVPGVSQAGKFVIDNPRGVVIMGGKDSGAKLDINDNAAHFINLNVPLFGIGTTAKTIAAARGAELSLYADDTVDDETLRRFLFHTCGFTGDWNMAGFVDSSVKSLRERIGDKKAILALSGGLDSTVCAVLLNKAIGRRLNCILVDHGFLRKGEADTVEAVCKDRFNINFTKIDTSERFISRLSGISDPEEKRKIIGREFIRIFEEEAKNIGEIDYLAQGTIYLDVIESGASSSPFVKTHHNVGGLPKDVGFKEIIEPLRYLFKEEVRQAGLELGIPEEIVWRQPFPGPGLAVRALGEITPERLSMLREADAIFRDEITAAGLSRNISQYFAVLTNMQSVGVKSGARSYENVIALRALHTDDFMTANIARLPYDMLEHTARRITNEVPGINRVVYDITSKPPATIEWE